MTEPVTLKGGGRTPTDESPLLRTEAYGLTGVGKSTFAATFPNPLWVANFDRSWAPIIEQLPDTHVVHYLEFPADADMMIRGIASDILLSLDKFLLKAQYSKDGGTFILDGADTLWDLVKAAKLPTNEGGEPPRDYFQPNNYMSSRYRKMASLPMHLVHVAAARTIWASASKETDMLESEGWKHRLRYITSQVRMFSPESRTKTPIVPTADKVLGRTFHGYLSLAKERPFLEGRVEPSINYLTLYRMLYRVNPPDAGKCWVPSWGPE